ncbi:MAG: Ig-like domain-containing protein [Croceitalea sp.]|nr:Ig-like domain-containing protein [Croceitalea sp.]
MISFSGHRFFCSPKVFEAITLLLLLCFSLGSAQTITHRIGANNDDAEERVSNGAITLNDNTLDLPFDGGNANLVGLRFSNVNVPKFAVITNASIQFTAAAKDNGASQVIIKGQAADNPTTFVNTDYNISSRPLTLTQINWDPSNWDTNQSGAGTTTKDISIIVQEIVDRAGWSLGNAMVFVLSPGNPTRRARSHDDNPAQAALLSITYFIPILPPTANDDDFAAYNFETTTFNPLNNDTDPNNNIDSTSLTNTTPLVVAGQGEFIINMDGTVDFIPEPGFVGTTSLGYRICDDTPAGSGGPLCDTATMTVEVRGNPCGTNQSFINQTDYGNNWVSQTNWKDPAKALGAPDANFSRADADNGFIIIDLGANAYLNSEITFKVFSDDGISHTGTIDAATTATGFPNNPITVTTDTQDPSVDDITFLVNEPGIRYVRIQGDERFGLESITFQAALCIDDYDGDLIDDLTDLDNDNDGIPNTAEANGYQPYLDEDGDGTLNGVDTFDNGTGDGSNTDYTDGNGDGIPDVYDFDLDGIPNHLDLDSDNDGIHDAEEAGHNLAHTNGVLSGPFGNNGLKDALETAVDNGVLNYVVIDTDIDEQADYLDLDSDGDGCFDALEAGFTDADLDGEVDGSGYASDGTVTGSDGYTGTDAKVTDPTRLTIACDTDGDGIAELADLDDDNDGLLDTEECTVEITFADLSETRIYSFAQATSGCQANHFGDFGTGNANDPLLLFDGDMNTELRMHQDDFLEFELGQIIPAGTTITLKEGTGGEDAPISVYVSQESTDPAGDANTGSCGGVAYANAIGGMSTLIQANADTNADLVFVAPFDITHIQFLSISSHGGWAEMTIDPPQQTLYSTYVQHCDSDNDGIPDSQDLDSDGDGCLDTLEAGFTDANNDGIVDGTGFDANGRVTGSDGYTGTDPKVQDPSKVALVCDTDNDYVNPLYDLDDDNDGIPDTLEGYGNLVKNFSFEQQDFSNVTEFPGGNTTAAGTYIGSNLNSNTLLGWDYDHNLDAWIEEESPTWSPYYFHRAYDGTQFVDVLGDSSLSGGANNVLSQTMATIPGEQYQVSFYWGEDVGHDTGEQVTLDFNVLDATLSPILSQTLTTTALGPVEGKIGPRSWFYYQQTFTATTTTSTISFSATPPGGNAGAGAALDFVIVQATTAVDTDLDGVPDYLDLDSDNDGIYDLVEAGSSGIDANADGVLDGAVLAFGDNGLLDALETTAESGELNYTVLNSDLDAVLDFRETDADDDGCSDANESYFDANADGGDNAYYGTGNPPAVDLNGLVTAATYPAPADQDGSGVPDYREADTQPSVSAQPVDSKICDQCNTSFAATGSDFDTLQWQLFNGTTWDDLSNGGVYSGVNTATLNITGANLPMHNNQYRLLLTNEAYICDPTQVSNTVTLELFVNTVITNRRITARINKL